MHNVANIDLIVSVGDNFYNVDPDDEEMDIDTDFSFEKKSLRSLYDVLNKPGIRKKEKKRLQLETNGLEQQMANKKYNKTKLLGFKHVLEKNYSEYVKLHYDYSFYKCFSNKLISKKWYLCLGNHDVEPVKKWIDMPHHQLCFNRNNKDNPICADLKIDGLQPIN